MVQKQGALSPKEQCASNLKKLGVAWLAYMADHDDRMPPENDYFRAPTDLIKTWYGEWGVAHSTNFTTGWLYPYLESVEVFHCPESRISGNAGLSYGLNVNIFWDRDEMLGKFRTFPEDPVLSPFGTDITRPDETILIGDAASFDQVRGAYPSAALDIAPYQDHGLAIGAHGGLTNLLWCDGHVKAMRPSPINLHAAFEPNPWTLNWFERKSHSGAIWRGSVSPDAPSHYGTLAFAGPAFYYLMDKLEG
jgi:prepilin-type processing-associated H-X9-DG protein